MGYGQKAPQREYLSLELTMIYYRCVPIIVFICFIHILLFLLFCSSTLYFPPLCSFHWIIFTLHLYWLFLFSMTECGSEFVEVCSHWEQRDADLLKMAPAEVKTCLLFISMVTPVCVAGLAWLSVLLQNISALCCVGEGWDEDQSSLADWRGFIFSPALFKIK